MRATGYFGIPGAMRGSAVHVVDNGVPVCGVRMGKRSEFQWCAPGVWFPYIECLRCKAWWWARRFTSN